MVLQSVSRYRKSQIRGGFERSRINIAKAINTTLRSESLTLIGSYSPETSRTEPRSAPASRNLNDQESQLLSMLGSTNLKTVRDAAKRIYRSPKLSKSVYDTVDRKIIQLLPRAAAADWSQTQSPGFVNP